MSIYIYGMDIPKNNMPLKAFIYPDGSVRVKLQGGGYLGLQAVTVNDHGRLIDADALRQDWLENGENEYLYDTNAFLDSLDEAPTIIPADKEEKT